jgi:hypothetical protein
MVSAQTSGGQISRRGAKKTIQKKTQPTSNYYAPKEMEPNTYYMCINETWVVKNGQDLCEKMAAKGYETELVKDPNPEFGYHVSVYKTKNINDAVYFYNNFDDDRWGIAYPFYNREYLSDFSTYVNSFSNGNNPYNESTHQKMMKVVVSSARINDTDITHKTVELKQSIILYTVSGEDLYMANYTEETNDQSWGTLEITDSQEQPETANLYRKIVLSCVWNFHNTYDNKAGKCPVTIETVFTPNAPFTTVTISIDEGNILTFSGNSIIYSND